MANPSTIDSLQIEINHKSTGAVSGITALASALRELKNAMSTGRTSLTPLNNQLDRLQSIISDFKGLGNLESLRDVLVQIKGVATQAADSIRDFNTAINQTPAIAKYRQLAQALAEAKRALDQFNAPTQNSSGGSSSSGGGGSLIPYSGGLTRSDTIDYGRGEILSGRTGLIPYVREIRDQQRRILDAQYRELEELEQELNGGLGGGSETGEAPEPLDTGGGGNDGGGGGGNGRRRRGVLGNILSMFRRVLMYRMIRGVIQGISNAVKEGTQNMYEWSKAFDGEFSTAIDNIKGSLLTIKNSLAAANAPLIEALVPLFQQLATWAAQAATAVSRFFAILTGADHYYSVAAGGATEYATAVGKAVQKTRTLLKFDEINRLEKKNSGSGGGSSGVNTSGMFTKEALGMDLSNLSFLSRLELALSEWGFNLGSVFSGDSVLGKFIDAVTGIGILNVLFSKAQGASGGSALKISFLSAIFSVSLMSMIVNAMGIRDTAFGSLVGELGSTAFAFGLAFFLSGGNVLTASIAGMMAFALSSVVFNPEGIKEKGFGAIAKALGVTFATGALIFGLTGNVLAAYIGASLILTIASIAFNAKGAKVSLSSVETRLNELKNYGYLGPGMSSQVPYTYGFAAGGYPDEGSLFIARENGPEMVGSIGNHTAVANNDQIVQAVASGVASAVNKEVLILQEQNSILRTIASKGTGISTGSLTSAFERENRRAGTTIIPVGG